MMGLEAIQLRLAHLVAKEIDTQIDLDRAEGPEENTGGLTAGEGIVTLDTSISVSGSPSQELIFDDDLLDAQCRRLHNGS